MTMTTTETDASDDLTETKTTIIERTRRLFAPLLLLSAYSAAPAWSTTFTVGPGKTFATPEQIAWKSVHPGDSIVIYPGTYPSLLGTGNSMIVSGVLGSAAKPISIQGSSAADLPMLTSGILVDGSQFIDIGNLDISRNPTTQPYAAVIVRAKSGNIVLSGLKIHGSYVGVNFTQTGLQNTLQKSAIFNNRIHGLTAGAPDASLIPDAAHQSVIAGNSIHDNGGHGIEVTGPFWRIERNQLTHNGTAMGGTSGVHLFTRTDTSSVDSCSHNQILYNYVTTQQDSIDVDGNGIQVDNFCDYNEVSFNVVWANAGAGISVLVAKGNVVTSNTSYSNARDATRATKFPGVFRGEIIMGSMANLCGNPNVAPASCHPAAGRASSNALYDNIVVSAQAKVPGIFVSPDSAIRNANTLYPNLYYNTGGSTTGVQLTWDDAAYYTAVTLDAVTGVKSKTVGNLVEPPNFLNGAEPGFGQDGLRLSKIPANGGRILNPATPDMLGASAVAGDSYYGAYYKSP